MNLVLASLIHAWVLGSLLAVVAVGLTLVFGLGRVVNFAIGGFYALGAYLTWWLSPTTGYVVAIVLAMMIVFIVGLATERATVRPLRNRPELVTLLSTYGMALVIEGAIEVIWGPYTQVPAAPIGGSVAMVGNSFTTFSLVAAGIAMVAAAGLWLMVRWARAGLKLRAASENPPMAGLLGIDTNWLFAAAFALSTAVTAIIGGLAGPIYSLYPEMSSSFLIDAFVAVVIGGLGSFRGAIVGAYVVAICQDVSLVWLSAIWANAISFGLVALVILLQPSGIFREGRALA